MANDNETQSPSGLPLTVEMYGDLVEGGEMPAQTAMTPSTSSVQSAPKHRSHPPVVVRETHTVEIEHDEDHDDELDEIIDRVIEVVKARRAGQAPPPRRSRKEREAAELNGPETTALANPVGAVAANPNKKAMIYAGVGIGAVALVGGLWWYFKKKE